MDGGNSSFLHASTPERRMLNALSLLCYSTSIGKAEQADLFESSLFQAVTQVNLTALNTLLLLTALCSSLAFSFIFFLLFCFKQLLDCFERSFFSQKLCALSASYRLFLRSFISFWLHASLGVSEAS